MKHSECEGIKSGTLTGTVWQYIRILTSSDLNSVWIWYYCTYSIYILSLYIFFSSFFIIIIIIIISFASPYPFASIALPIQSYALVPLSLMYNLLTCILGNDPVSPVRPPPAMAKAAEPPSKFALAVKQLMAGAGAGCVTKTSVAPLERIKILFQLQGMRGKVSSS